MLEFDLKSPRQRTRFAVLISNSSNLSRPESEKLS